MQLKVQYSDLLPIILVLVSFRSSCIEKVGEEHFIKS